MRELPKSVPPPLPARSPRIVYATRHGETDWNAQGRWQGHTDIPLNDVGRMQARAVADRIRVAEPGKIAGIVSSDLSRAHETATIIGALVHAEVVAIEPALRERRFGIFEGLTREECATRYDEHYRRWSDDARETPPGAESHADIEARVTAAVLRAALEITPHEAPILVVSHGGALRAFLGTVTRTPFGPISNTALYRIAFDGVRFVSAVLC